MQFPQGKLVLDLLRTRLCICVLQISFMGHHRDVVVVYSVADAMCVLAWVVDMPLVDDRLACAARLELLRGGGVRLRALR